MAADALKVIAACGRSAMPPAAHPPPIAPAQAEGNAAFSAGRFEEAASKFGEAIAVDPSNHVLYSNRSAALASLHRYQEALEDAEKVGGLCTRHRAARWHAAACPPARSLAVHVCPLSVARWAAPTTTLPPTTTVH